MKKTILSAVLLLALLLSAPAALAFNGPTAVNLELETPRGQAMEGQLLGKSEEGLALTYRITTEPVKGTLELAEDGSFVYTPLANRRGRDYFGYKATDAWGRESQEATVIIHLLKAKE